jgi:hypothetical protein
LTRFVVARVRRLKNLPGKGRPECSDVHNAPSCRDCTRILRQCRYRRFGLARVPFAGLAMPQPISQPAKFRHRTSTSVDSSFR